MGTSSPTLLVSAGDQLVCIRVIGRANFTSSVTLKTLVQELIERGYRRFALELHECITMDSTFLGVLAGLALKMRESGNESGLRLVNPSARVTDLLDNLGVAHLFRIAQDAAPVAGGAAVPEAAASKEELSRTCLEAHQTLMDLNPDNVPKFKEVAQFLAEDLQKLKKPGEPPERG